MKIFNFMWNRMSLILWIILLPWSLIIPKDFQHEYTAPLMFVALIIQDIVIWINEVALDKYKEMLSNEPRD